MPQAHTRPRAQKGDVIERTRYQCSVPNQIKWTSKVEGTHIILPRMTLPWHLVATSFHFIGVEQKKYHFRTTWFLSSHCTWKGARVGGNATVTDPDHLPGHSKVILGNIICLWSIPELYLGRIGREELVLVQNFQKMCENWGDQNHVVFRKNTTKMDTDHLPGHSKVILGNIICVWTVFELHLGWVGR